MDNVNEKQKITKNPEIPTELIEAAKELKLVVFVGAGASQIIGCSSWGEFSKDLIMHGCKEGYINCETATKLLEISDNREKVTKMKLLFEENNDKASFEKKLKSALTANQSDLANYNIYEQLYKFPASFVTTNADCYFTEKFDNHKVTVGNAFEPKVDDYIKTLVHLHGKLDDKDSLVFTLDEYFSLYGSESKNRSLKKYLTHIFKHKTVLFIGYSVSELELIFYMLEEYKLTKNKHYMLKGFRKEDKEIFQLESLYREKLGLEVVPFLLEGKLKYKEQYFILKSLAEKFNIPEIQRLYSDRIIIKLEKLTKLGKTVTANCAPEIVNILEEDPILVYSFSLGCNPYWIPEILKSKALNVQFEEKLINGEIEKMFQHFLNNINGNQKISYPLLSKIKFYLENEKLTGDKHAHLLNVFGKIVFEFPNKNKIPITGSVKEILRKIVQTLIDLEFQKFYYRTESLLIDFCKYLLAKPDELTSNFFKALLDYTKIGDENFMFLHSNNKIRSVMQTEHLKMLFDNLVPSITAEKVIWLINIVQDLLIKTGLSREEFSSISYEMESLERFLELREKDSCFDLSYPKFLLYCILKLINSIKSQTEIETKIAKFVDYDCSIFTRIGLYFTNFDFLKYRDFFWNVVGSFDDFSTFLFVINDVLTVVHKNNSFFVNNEIDKILSLVDIFKAEPKNQRKEAQLKQKGPNNSFQQDIEKDFASLFTFEPKQSEIPGLIAGYKLDFLNSLKTNKALKIQKAIQENLKISGKDSLPLENKIRYFSCIKIGEPSFLPTNSIPISTFQKMETHLVKKVEDYEKSFKGKTNHEYLPSHLTEFIKNYTDVFFKKIHSSEVFKHPIIVEWVTSCVGENVLKNNEGYQKSIIRYLRENITDLRSPVRDHNSLYLLQNFIFKFKLKSSKTLKDIFKVLFIIFQNFVDNDTPEPVDISSPDDRFTGWPPTAQFACELIFCLFINYRKLIEDLNLKGEMCKFLSFLMDKLVENSLANHIIQILGNCLPKFFLIYPKKSQSLIDEMIKRKNVFNEFLLGYIGYGQFFRRFNETMFRHLKCFNRTLLKSRRLKKHFIISIIGNFYAIEENYPLENFFREILNENFKYSKYAIEYFRQGLKNRDLKVEEEIGLRRIWPIIFDSIQFHSRQKSTKITGRFYIDVGKLLDIDSLRPYILNQNMIYIFNKFPATSTNFALSLIHKGLLKATKENQKIASKLLLSIISKGKFNVDEFSNCIEPIYKNLSKSETKEHIKRVLIDQGCSPR